MIIALAIESNISLSNSVVEAFNPDEAVEKLVNALEMFEGEEIHLICADVMRGPGIDDERAEKLRRDVESKFEQAVPELFAPGYFEDAA